MAPERIGKYQVLDEIAVGGQGAVYRAFDPDSGMIVAVKVLLSQYSSNESFVERFRREASLIQSIEHENVVKIYDFGVSDSQNFMALEFIPESLSGLIELTGKLPPQRAVALGIGISEGIGYAHSQGIIHRDIKPQNVLLTPQGVPKVTDFGIARGDMLNTMTSTGVMMGTPFYMSPEQANGERADARSDVYSLGCLLYQLLTGDLPFSADTPLAVLRKHVEDDPEPLRLKASDIPYAVARCVEQAMSKDPERRFSDGMVFAAALRQAMPEATVGLRAEPSESAGDEPPPIARQSEEIDSKETRSEEPAKTPEPSTPQPRPPLEDAAFADLSKTAVDELLDVAQGASREQPRYEPMSDPLKLASVEKEVLEARLRNARSESEKSRLAATILALMFGGLGIHRFYLGKNGTGIIQLILTFVTYGIAGLWGFVDGLRFLFGRGITDSEGKHLAPFETSAPRTWILVIAGGIGLLAIIGSASSASDGGSNSGDFVFAPTATRTPSPTPRPTNTAVIPPTATAAPAPTPVPTATIDCVTIENPDLAGEIVNLTFGRSVSTARIILEQTGCYLVGELIIDPPLYGSGSLEGFVEASDIAFNVSGLTNDVGADLTFIGSVVGNELIGEYFVVDTGEYGEWIFSESVSSIAPTAVPTPLPTVPVGPIIVYADWLDLEGFPISTAVEGDEVWLYAETLENYDGLVDVNVYEADPFDVYDLVVSGEMEFVNGIGWANWVTHWEDDGLLGLGDDPEYVFEVLGEISPELSVSPVPGAQPTATPVPTAIPASFYLGATKDDVLAVQGTPTEINSSLNWWSYGGSRIEFDSNDVVEGWLNDGELKLTTIRTINSTYFVGASKSTVRSIQGNPTEIQIALNWWSYGSSRVQFDDDNFVEGFVNDGDLKLTPANLTASNFTLGDTKETVRSAQGNPTEIQPALNWWMYGGSRVEFDSNDHVSGWLSTGNLNLAPVPTPTATPTPTPTATPAPSTLTFSHSSTYFINTGDTLILTDAFVSSSIPGEAITGRIDWGEGDGFELAAIITSTGQYVGSHTYNIPTTFTVTLRANADSGSFADSTFSVVVTNP